MQINKIRLEQVLPHYLSLLQLLLLFLNHFLLQLGCFSFPHCLKRKALRDFFAVGHVRVNTQWLLLASFQSG